MQQAEMSNGTPSMEFATQVVHDGNSASEIPGSVTVFHLEGETFGQMHEVIELSVSECGLDGRSSEPVSPGAVVSMGFEAPGHPARRGEVVGCVRHGEQWKVGIQFEANTAA